jgi:hypothetical protein
MLQVPNAFLRAGGYVPAVWYIIRATVKLLIPDKPSDVWILGTITWRPE